MIYILDRREKIIGVLNNNGTDNSSPYFDDLMVEDLATGSDTYPFKTFANTEQSENLEVGNYIARKDLDGYFKLFQIVQVEEEHNDTLIKSIYAESAGLELLNEIVRPFKQDSINAKDAMIAILNNTRWKVGKVDKELMEVNSLNIENYENTYKVLQNVATLFDGELRFRVTIKAGQVADRYVDLLKERGVVTKKRFEYGKDILNIKKTVDASELVTALIGVGKSDENGDNITFKSISWSKSNGNLADKPLNQDFIEDKEAKKRWDTQGNNILGVYEVDTSSPEELIRLTWKELQRRKNPKISYELDVALLERLVEDKEHEEVRIGDTVYVIDNSFEPPLYLSARVTRLETSFTDSTKNKCTLSNFKEVKSNIDATMRNITNKLLFIPTTTETLEKITAAKTEAISTSNTHANTVSSVAETNAKNYTDAQLVDYVEATTFNFDIQALQSQIDGNVTTWFYAVDPTLTNVPTVNWNTTDFKNQHLGDLYYNTVSGYAFRFMLNGSTYSWTRIQDTDVTKALLDAAKAQDTADNKRRVFVSTPTIPYDIGDLWTQGASGDLYKCKVSRLTGSYNAADWEKAVKYTDDTKANEVSNKVTDMASDSKLTPTEKIQLKKELDIVINEKTNIEAQADVYAISKTNYQTYYTNLYDFVNPLVTDLTTTSDVVGTTLRTKFNDYYKYKALLLKDISNATKNYSDTKKTEAIDAASLDAINKINDLRTMVKLNGIELLDLTYKADTTALPKAFADIYGDYSIAPATELGGNVNEPNLIKGINAGSMYTPYIACNTTGTQYFKVSVYNQATNVGTIYAQCCYYDKDKVAVATNYGALGLITAKANTSADMWQTHEGYIDPIGSTDVRQKAVYMRLRILTRYSNQLGVTYLKDLSWKQLAPQNIADLETRVKSAEIKITPSAIANVVKAEVIDKGGVNKVVTAIGQFDLNGLTITQQNGETVSGNANLNTEGLILYDSNGQERANFGRNDQAYIRDLQVENIDAPNIIQLGRKGSVTYYVSPTSSGDGSGRDINNKCNSINRALENALKNQRYLSMAFDVIIDINGGVYNEDVTVEGVIGSGRIIFRFQPNSIVTGYWQIYNNMPYIQLISTGTIDTAQMGTLIHPQTVTNELIYVENSIVELNKLRLDAKNKAQIWTSSRGSKVLTLFCDMINAGQCAYNTVGGESYIVSCRGNVTKLAASAYGGSCYVHNSAPNYTTPWTFEMGGFGSDMGHSKVASLYSPPAITWQWLENSFSLSNYRSYKGTSLVNGEFNQSNWGSYTDYRGYADIPNGLKSWCTGGRNFTLWVTVKRKSTNHGYSGAIPTPRFKQPDGTFWNSGVGIARGESKTIQLPSTIANAIVAGTMTVLEVFDTSQDNYIQFETNVSIKVKCEKQV
jgi:phage minor structural protein